MNTQQITIVLTAIAIELLLYFIGRKSTRVSTIFTVNFLKLAVIVSTILYLLKSREVIRNFLGASTLLVVVLGFTIQNSLKNIISGAIISFSKSFQIGDRISLPKENVSGYIENLTLRHAVIRDYGNNHIVVPNSLFAEAVVINQYMFDKEAGYSFNVVLPSTDTTQLTQILSNSNTIRFSLICVEGKADAVKYTVWVWTDSIEDSFETVSKIKKTILDNIENVSVER